jgi:hypothetical protein
MLQNSIEEKAVTNKQRSKPTTTKINKSAVDGKIVSNAYAKTHPDTTYAQAVKKTAIKKGK